MAVCRGNHYRFSSLGITNAKHWVMFWMFQATHLHLRQQLCSPVEFSEAVQVTEPNDFSKYIEVV